MARDEINAFLGAGTNYNGRLRFEGTVRIDGNFTGEVESSGTLVIGQEAVVEGHIKVGQLVLSGTIRGDVVAEKKAVLHGSANMQGNIFTPSLVVEEGAVLEGKLSMRADSGADGSTS